MSRKLCGVVKTYNSDEFILYLLEIIHSYPQHKWIAHNQEQAMIDVLATLKGGHVVSCWDYSENASLAKKLNVQAEHFSKVQVMLLICVNYLLRNSVLAKTVNIYVSDDRKHSAKFVHYCMDLQKAYFQADMYLKHGDTHFVLSDGAPTHLNMVGKFWYLARYGVDEGVRMVWNFFQSCHSKGEWDGEGAIAKDGLRQSI